MPPEGFSYPPPNCGIVEGNCDIFTVDFWRMRSIYETYETEVGVYPEPPLCMRAVDEGDGDSCEPVVTYLYPDGTLGDAPWVLDLGAPQGWRLL